jgi:hypothetical protein
LITETYYNAKMQETFKLMGTSSKTTYEMAHAIYNRISHNYTDTDLEQALDSIMQSDNPRINYPILLRCLNLKRSFRFEEKARADRANGEDGARKFWEQDAKENCITRNCSHCQRRAGRCDTIAKHTLAAIKMMMQKDWRVKRKEESFQDYSKEMRNQQHSYNEAILNELDRQFPGVGFGGNREKKEFYTRDELKLIYTGVPQNTQGHKPSQLKLVDPDFPEELNDRG